ncbi:MAG: hypothetical protein CL868_07745 [Cytophagaceae bacterium]|nr:hypothetical protein [Cytophagaceae bacterium]|tara:strand:- start:30082 stop:30864 length:783 start_codon:yes stop_codon:yes gene_type:complete
MRKILILILFAVAVAACKKDTKKENEEAAMVSFEHKNISEDSLPQCKDTLCPTININSLTAKGTRPLDKNINKALDDKLVALFTMSPDDEGKIKTLDDGIDNFVTSFKEYKNDFPKSQAGYELEATTTVSYESPTLLSLDMESYTYWGGAHGYGSTSYFNFDKKTGKQLSNDDLIKDKKAFLALAEKKFRELQQVPEGESINSTGYMFENDTFALPINIGFENNEMVLLYNPYEVASYADGIIEIRFAVSEVQDLLAINP